MAGAERLQEWVRQQLAAGLPALAGARVTGTVPVQVALLNDLIAEALADATRAEDRGAAAAGATPGLDLPTLARLVRRVRVDAAPGVITLDFEVGVDG